MTIVSLSYLIICTVRAVIIAFNRDDILSLQLGLPATLMAIVSFIAFFITLYIEFYKENEELK